MKTRRNFLKATLIASVASALSPNTFAFTQTNAIKGKRLKKGDTIGLIAPSSNVWENQEIQFAVDVLKSFGFKVKLGQHIFNRKGYLAGGDEGRAFDLNSMFSDKSVDGIFCLRGGYGSPRILPLIDFEAIKKNPKVFMGYSDITALLNAITTKTGLITFHGPIARQNFSDYTVKQFKDIVMNPSPKTVLAKPPFFEPKEGQAEKDNRLTTVVDGQATGELIGGNLSLLVKLVGTPYEPNYENKILFLEDVEEEPYRIDGMLTHLKLAGRFDRLAGIAFGKCTDCTSKGNSLSIEEVVFDRLGDLKIPVLKGMMIGHIEDNATIPVGAKAMLDSQSQTLTLLERAVI